MTTIAYAGRGRAARRHLWPESILARALLLVTVPGLVLVGLLVAFSLAQARQTEAQRWSVHTAEVIEQAQQLLTLLVDAQTGIRGYLITRDPSFLEPYRLAVLSIPATTARMRELTRDNLQQQARARQIEERTRIVLTHYEESLRDSARPTAVAIVTRGKALMDALRADVATFRAEEQRLESVRRHELERADSRLFAVVTGGVGASMFAMVALGVWFNRALRSRVRELTHTARRLTEGREAEPSVARDELAAVDKALHNLAGTLARQQRAVVGALADAVSLFSAAGSHRAVLDVSVERALALVDAGVAVCTLEVDTEASQVVAAAVSPTHPSAAPAPGTTFAWSGAAEVLATGRAVCLSAEQRQHRGVPSSIERVFGEGEWVGLPITDDRRTAIGVLQVAAPAGRTFSDDDRDVIGTLAHAASVALALERSRHRLEAVNADLQLTNRENELFIYSVSHDLRSPLVNLEGFSRELESSISTMRRLLERPDVPASFRDGTRPLLDQDMAESVRFIRTAVGRLAGIIDGLLRLSRAGRVEYRIQPLDLERILGRVVDAMQATLAAAGAEVRVAPLPSVAGDALAIEQVFANLIGNASTYVRSGVAPRIEVSAEDDLASTSGRAVIRVSDNGLGIPETHLEKIFQPLQRLHAGVGRGEGMGLAIVRRIVERHGGRIWVRSQVGAGTTFYVELPRSMEGGTSHGS